jgi:hypothetical protein
VRFTAAAKATAFKKSVIGKIKPQINKPLRLPISKEPKALLDSAN